MQGLKKKYGIWYVLLMVLVFFVWGIIVFRRFFPFARSTPVLPLGNSIVYDITSLQKKNGYLQNISQENLSLVQRNLDYLVHITTEKIASGNSIISLLGQGILLNQSWYILTNKHVVQDVLDPLYVEYYKEKYPVENIWRDEQYDIALLKISGSFSTLINPQFQETIRKALLWTVFVVTRETIQNENRNILSGSVVFLQTGDNQEILWMYYTKISGFPGDSGSMLVDQKGNIIGINTAIDTLEDNYLYAYPLSEEMIATALQSVIQDHQLILP